MVLRIGCIIASHTEDSGVIEIPSIHRPILSSLNGAHQADHMTLT